MTNSPLGAIYLSCNHIKTFIKNDDDQAEVTDSKGILFHDISLYSCKGAEGGDLKGVFTTIGKDTFD